MRVIKVLNTSVVLALNDAGEEVILMGKGIGFRKSIGEVLPTDNTDKVFVLRDRNITKSIIRLAAETDAEIFGIAKEIIDYGKTTYHMNLMDHIYLSLTDHIAFAVRRVQEKIQFPGFYSLEIRRFNPDEFAIGCYALKLIQQELGVTLPEGEAGNIAFHFINAQKDYPKRDENRRMMELVRDITELVKYTFGVVYNTETIAYSRFMTHLQFLAQRAVSGQQLAGDTKDLLWSGVAETCHRELLCAKKISDFIKTHHHIQLTEQEELYLAIHIHRVLEENVHHK